MVNAVNKHSIHQKFQSSYISSHAFTDHHFILIPQYIHQYIHVHHYMMTGMLITYLTHAEVWGGMCSHMHEHCMM